MIFDLRWEDFQRLMAGAMILYIEGNLDIVMYKSADGIWLRCLKMFADEEEMITFKVTYLRDDNSVKVLNAEKDITLKISTY